MPHMVYGFSMEAARFRTPQGLNVISELSSYFKMNYQLEFLVNGPCEAQHDYDLPSNVLLGMLWSVDTCLIIRG